MWSGEKSRVFGAEGAILTFLLRLGRRVNFTGIWVSSSSLSNVKSITTCFLNCGVTATELDGLGVGCAGVYIAGNDLLQLDLALFAFDTTPGKERRIKSFETGPTTTPTHFVFFALSPGKL